MMVKIYCNNIDCTNISSIGLYTRPGRLFEEAYVGMCSGKVLINRVDIESSKVNNSYSICVGNKTDFKCLRIDCLFNDCNGRLYGNCIKDEIYIDKAKIQGEVLWVCKSFSNIKISGHRDWSSNLNSDGRPKFGGHLDDNIAERMYQDSLKFKSFGTHHKEAKEPKRKVNI